MTEKEIKKTAAKPAAKAAAAKSAKAAPKAPSARTPKEKRVHEGASLTVTQIGSPIGRRADQRATLVGLGLNKIRRTRTLPDTAEVRGMVEKVKHLITVEKA